MLLYSVPPSASAGDWQPVDKLSAADSWAAGEFGYSTAVVGDMILVGAREHGELGWKAGAAHVFERDDDRLWNETQFLLASDGAAYDRFGHSVAATPEFLFVGAPYSDRSGLADVGAVYIFVKQSGVWEESAKLIPSDVAVSGKFGWSLAAQGEWLVVGANSDDDLGSASGSVYIFRLTDGSYIQHQKLLASDGAAGDKFGCAVSLSGAILVVGAERDDDAGPSSGSAYVFDLSGDTWSEVAKLTASDGAAGDQFGQAVAASAGIIVVGSTGADEADYNGGAAYVFSPDGGDWSETAKLLAASPSPLAQFGCSVAILDDRVMVGACRDDAAGEDSGAVYVYAPDGDVWDVETELIASDAYRWDEFGNAIAVSDGTVVVGAHFEWYAVH